MMSIFVIVFVIQYAACKLEPVEIPSEATANVIAETFSKSLKRYINGFTNYASISNDFEKLAAEDVDFKKVDGESLANDFRDRLESLFAKKYDALAKIKRRAERSRLLHEYNPNIPQFDYSNIRYLKEDENHTEVAIDPAFSKVVEVNKSRSFVQVPTNIYAYKKEILNVAKWTKDLDAVFLDNEVNGTDPSLTFQYYGDSSGLFRMYPGNKNNYGKDDVDLYDCRRRVWYKAASASSKNVIIIIDTSGSMIGNNIGIAKIAAKSLIDTLGENDYFNVLTLNISVNYVLPCVKYLIQATKVNKEMVKSSINNITDPTNIFNISQGVKEAFKIFRSGDTFNRTYAGCNQIIMVITDGIEGDYTSAGKKEFEEYNSNKEARVFSYLVGRMKGPHDRALKEMACNNRGHFYKIETLGNVWDTVLKYLEVLSRPMAQQSSEQTPKYSPIYLDSSGNGMVMTMSLGVYNKYNLTGVVGMDLLMRTLKQEVPQRELGSFGHEILINNNGFVLMHPKFRDQTGYLPVHPNIYLEDLEYSVEANHSVLLKKEMIDRLESKMTFPVYWLYDKSRKMTVLSMKYYFKPINSTEFSLAIAVSSADETLYNVKTRAADTWFEKGLQALYVYEPENKTENYTQTNFTYINIAPWMYCRNISNYPKNMQTYPSAKELYEFLLGTTRVSDLPKVCDAELVKKLLTSAAIVHARVNETWPKFKIDELETVQPLKSVYVLTSGGYSRYFSHYNQTELFDRDVFRTSLFEEPLAQPWIDLFISTPPKESMTSPPISYVDVSAASWMGPSDNKVLAAVSGLKLSREALGIIFDNATNTGKVDCSDNNTMVCAVIDQSGFIVASNQGPQYIGVFIGEIQGPLIAHLSNVNVSVFKKVVLEDTQAECLLEKVFDSAASFLLTPAKIILDFVSMLAKTTWFLLFHLFAILASILRNDQVNGQTIDMMNVSCTKTMSFYLFQDHKWKELLEAEKIEKRRHTNKRKPIKFREITCDKGSKQEYIIANITGTNLLFLFANQSDAFSCRRKRESLKHVRKDDEDFCVKKEKYRRKPATCFNTTVDYDSESEFCGRGGTISPSVLAVLCLSAICLIFR